MIGNSNMEFPKHGEIWLVALDPIVGSEVGKTRPALVISNDRNNQFSDTVTLIPITSKAEKLYPFEVYLPSHETHLAHDSKAKANQIRTVDKRRLLKFLTKLSLEKLVEVERAILIHLGIPESRRNDF
jgi:mRNA interferase MazF